MKPTIFIGADHAGFELKNYLVSVLRADYDVVDCGPTQLDKQDDYPDFAKIVCEKVLDHNARGILICDTGIGMSIGANRYQQIRAALVTTQFMAERTRLHNNSNILCLGQDVVSQDENEAFTRTWLSTDFSGEERHVRRIEKLDELG